MSSNAAVFDLEVARNKRLDALLKEVHELKLANAHMRTTLSAIYDSARVRIAFEAADQGLCWDAVQDKDAGMSAAKVRDFIARALGIPEGQDGSNGK